MRNYLPFVAATVLLAITSAAPAADQAQSARMGSGLMTFDTVPGWGLRPDGSSALGPTHGGVVIDSKGNIYTSANKGVVVCAEDG